MKLKYIALISILFMALYCQVHAQTASFGMQVYPQISIPVGAKAENYSPGVGAGMEGLFSFSAIPTLSIGVNTGYLWLPLNIAQNELIPDTNLSLIDYGLSLKAGIPFGDRLSIYGKGSLSAFTLIMSGNIQGSATGVKYNVGGGINIILGKQLALQAGAVFDSYPGLYEGLSVNIGITTRFSGHGSIILPRSDFNPGERVIIPDGGSIEFLNAEIDPIFPVLYKYYFSNPVGKVTVVNKGKETVRDVKVRLSLSQYIDTPELSAKIEELQPGEEKEIDLFIFFNYSVLSISEGARLAGELKADYYIGDYPASDISTVRVDTYDRNAMKWDDDRKMATFITARDEEIQRYARNVASMVRNNNLAGFNTEFQQGIAYLAAMDLTGCTYVIDPSSSYAELSSNSSALDAIQFPRQTLEYKAGDCDDLTTTYTTLLESVGVETAFITVPGHIYSAFKLNMTKSEAKRTFSQSDNLITDEKGQLWVPVETTALSEGFLKAWELGAKQWKEYSDSGKARLYPTREAWNLYEPVAFKVSDYKLETPDREELINAFKGELDAYVERELSLKERIYLTKLEQHPNHPQILNSLGVLYARYDRGEEAKDYFEMAVSDRPYAPALVNLGNMSYLKEDYYGAGSYYQRALNSKANSAVAILGLARVSHALNDFKGAQERYEELETLSPELAERFTYLIESSSNTSRASNAIIARSSVAWDEEE